jgi:hypothetical protein
MSGRRRWPIPGAASVDTEAPPADSLTSAAWSIAYPLHALSCRIDAAELTVHLNQLEGAGKTESLNRLDTEGRAPLHYAAWNGLVAPCVALLAAGAEVDVRSGDRGSTPLHFAAGMGHASVVEVLLKGGAAPSARDWVDKWSPLELARQDLFKAASTPEIIQALLRAGARAGAQ